MTGRADNYEISRDRAKVYFLGFDQQTLIRRWGLNADEGHIYVRFLGEAYALCRKTGAVLRCADGSEAGYGEALSVFDLLCHSGEEKHPAFSYAPVNSLPGRSAAVDVGTDFHSAAAEAFDRDPERFAAACRSLGGESVPMGDLGFRFPVFGELQVILKFYRADEDFPAAVTLLWDKSMLQYVFYETVFYIAGVLLEKIRRQMAILTGKPEIPGNKS